MVIRGGENVYPREIEEFLYRHPKVQDVQVIGVPDQKYGEEICAWIKLRAGPERHGRGDPRVLQGPDRPLQDPALHRVRGRLPDDHHRQDPEVRDARADDRQARPEGAEDGLVVIRCAAGSRGTCSRGRKHPAMTQVLFARHNFAGTGVLSCRRQEFAPHADLPGNIEAASHCDHRRARPAHARRDHGRGQAALRAQVPQFAKLVDVAGASAEVGPSRSNASRLLRGGPDVKRGPVAFLINQRRANSRVPLPRRRASGR